MLAILVALVEMNVPATDLSARFKTGELLCVNPDEHEKTCSNIDHLIVRADGVLIATSETLLAPDKSITLEMSSQVRLEDGAVCSMVDMTDLRKTIVRDNGAPLPPDRTAPMLEKLFQGLQRAVVPPARRQIALKDAAWSNSACRSPTSLSKVSAITGRIPANERIRTCRCSGHQWRPPKRYAHDISL